jgi:hypothetical protein
MIGRPEAGEAAEYYGKYIALATGSDIIEALERQSDLEERLFSEISEDRSMFRYAPGKWSIRQLLNHVTDTERAFAFRALWFARGFSEPLPGYDQDIAAAGSGADNIPWARHIEEFRNVRLSTIILLRNLPPEAWMREGVASGNRFTVRALAYITAGHSAHHLNILKERYR